MSREILNGWKEISRHIGRSARTAQRWEARLGMPVYRPALKDRSAVVAFCDELDLWIARASPARDEDEVLNSEIVLHSDSMVFGEDLRGLLNERGSAPGLRNWTVNQSNPDSIHRFPGKTPGHKR